MKKNRLLLKITLIGLLLFSTIMLSAGVWDYLGFYQKTSFRKFQRARQPHMKMKFLKINEELIAAAIFYETNRVRMRHRLMPFKYSRYLQLSAYNQSASYILAKYKRGYKVMPIVKRVQRFSRFGYKIINENIADLCGLNAPAGTHISFSHGNRRRLVYIDMSTGVTLKPLRYMQFARKIVALWMKHPVTRRNILNPKLKVMGTAGILYLKGKYRIPIIKCVQVFADGISDETDTGDIRLVRRPTLPPKINR